MNRLDSKTSSQIGRTESADTRFCRRVIRLGKICRRSHLIIPAGHWQYFSEVKSRWQILAGIPGLDSTFPKKVKPMPGVMCWVLHEEYEAKPDLFRCGLTISI